MTRDYGRAGRIGVGTPQSNPTVEAEFGILLPRRCSLHITRLRSTAEDAGERLVEYLERLDIALDAFDHLRPDVFGFACTGSSYLVGPEREARIIEAASMARGYPIHTATGAIRWVLERLGARRLAVVAPYPAELGRAGVEYWRALGIDVVQYLQIAIASGDTRSIYQLRSADADQALHALDLSRVDAVLLSGTGLPTLATLARWSSDLPLLTSNFCLASRLLAESSHDASHGYNPLEIAGWRERLAEAFP